jgi:hypothetical protein
LLPGLERRLTKQELENFNGEMKWFSWESRGRQLIRASEACGEMLEETSGEAAKRIKRAMKALEGAIEVCEAELSKLTKYQPPAKRQLRITDESVVKRRPSR